MHLTQLNCKWETSTCVHHRTVWFCNTTCYWRKFKIFLWSSATIIWLLPIIGQEVPLKMCEVYFMYHLLWKLWVLCKSMLIFCIIGSCDWICSSHNQFVMWFVSFYREHDEEVGLGEVDERVSMVMVCHVYEAHSLYSGIWRLDFMSSNAEMCKTRLLLLVLNKLTLDDDWN